MRSRRPTTRFGVRPPEVRPTPTREISFQAHRTQEVAGSSLASSVTNGLQSAAFLLFGNCSERLSANLTAVSQVLVKLAAQLAGNGVR
jgi:hypothetical protein